MLYAGDAPDTVPPIRTAPCMVTGYHIVFGLKSVTVSPSLKLYLTNAVDSHVEYCLTAAHETRTVVWQFVKPLISFEG
jgi:hypothetical protein